MKLTAGILGYGNLGKSLEKSLQKNDNFDLKVIFSRRNLDNKLYAPAKQIESYAGQLDVLFVALGSYNDIANNVNAFAPFDTVDSFDTHAKITDYKGLLESAKPNTISLCATGWDPGVLSIARGIFSLGNAEVYTFWGRGISQGHSNALRAIKGVLDAVQITEPRKEALQSAQRGEFVPENQRHQRICYVACVESEKEQVEKEIKQMPHYFCGQQVSVNFCSVNEIRKIKQNTAHAGRVIACGEGYNVETHLHVDCNTDYTAQIMLAYAKAIPQLKKDGYLGALDPFDIPLKYLCDSKLL